MEYGLIGKKLGHSWSREIHALIGDYPYELREVAPEDLRDFFAARDFRGINVTIPYKTDIIPFLDRISPGAERIGAVNTVVNRGGKLYGFNTDCDGLKSLILRVTGGRRLSGKVLIAGTGGTAKTAETAAAELGADITVKLSRTGKDGAATYAEAAELHRDASFIINATPAGMFPDDEGMATDPALFPALRGAADAVYHPLRTRFVMRAEELGLPARGGLYMLVSQAVAASSHFFGKEADGALTGEIFGKIAESMENIVLTGMPGSGKTSVGKEIARLTGRKFIDTDDEIVKADGRPIPRIFAESGEEFFRDTESAVIARISANENGAVIATGGGAVLRRENVRRLKSGGKIYLLDRPPEMLIPTADRPLARSAADVAVLREKRMPVYLETADEITESVREPRSVAEAILGSRAKELAEGMKRL